MYISNYTHLVDNHLNSVLHERGTNTSVFAWYMAVGQDVLSSHNLINEEEIGDASLYESMKLHCAPRASFYTQSQHFSQNAKQAANLHNAESPSLLIHFYNCLMPQSLTPSTQAQLLPQEVIANTPARLQKKLWEESFFSAFKAFTPHNQSQEGALQVSLAEYTIANSAFDTQSEMPTSPYANAMFESVPPSP